MLLMHSGAVPTSWLHWLKLGAQISQECKYTQAVSRVGLVNSDGAKGVILLQAHPISPVSLFLYQFQYLFAVILGNRELIHIYPLY